MPSEAEGLERVIPERIVARRFSGDREAAREEVERLIGGVGFAHLVRWCEECDEWELHNGETDFDWATYLKDNPEILLATAVRYADHNRRRELGGETIEPGGAEPDPKPTGKFYTAQELARLAYADDGEEEGHG